MKSQIVFAAAMVAAAATVIGIMVFTVEKRSAEPKPLVDEMTLEPNDAFSFGDSSESAATSDTSMQVTLEPEPVLMDTIEVSFSNVSSAETYNGLAYVGTGGGVFIYDPAEETIEILSVNEGLSDPEVTALHIDAGILYVGTKSGLFKRDEAGQMIPIAPELKSEVTAIACRDTEIYIGTRADGAIRISPVDTTVILNKPDITDLTLWNGDIWIAAFGEGIYRFNGVRCVRRYLSSDSTAFDRASTLASMFNRLYVGTPDGMYVYDGGSWDLYDADDGLFVCDITAITFKGWKILAGTRDWGYFEIFEDWVCPVAWSEALHVTALAADAGTVVVGTPESGAYVTKGDIVKNINPKTKMLEIPQFAAF
jgi:ligand-binding sensor domain-containing protein